MVKDIINGTVNNATENKTTFDGIDLASLRYSNKKKDSNIQSWTLIYLFEMIFENDITSYDYIDNYNKWSIEHVLNDSTENDGDGFIGNLFPCTRILNNSFSNDDYDQKRTKYLACQYKWINDFGNKYKKFGLKNINKRTEELNKKFISIINPDYATLNKFINSYSKK